jgi:hypothetical protein
MAQSSAGCSTLMLEYRAKSSVLKVRMCVIPRTVIAARRLVVTDGVSGKKAHDAAIPDRHHQSQAVEKRNFRREQELYLPEPE